MVHHTKLGKGRRDKYYHLAKRSNYRSRAAFKLLQINEKFGVLNNAQSCIDLCAAPGGWSQVCATKMPVSSTIIAVDLDPIKHIPGVITHQADITTEHCRQLLRRDLGGKLVNVVVHDGAPCCGTDWSYDAAIQNTLAMWSLKLATEFLEKNGHFVTKIFQSKDSQTVFWVLTQLFEKVHVFKPDSSRSTSAESFFVALNYKKPAEIDERLLDTDIVFSDGFNVEQERMTLKQAMRVKSNGKIAVNREGYDSFNGQVLLEKRCTVADFLNERRPLEILGRYNVIEWRADTTATRRDVEGWQEADLKVLQHFIADCPASGPAPGAKNLCPEEIRLMMQDTQVLSHNDYNKIMKWHGRTRAIVASYLTDESAAAAVAATAAEAEAEEAAPAEMNEEQLMDHLENRRLTEERRQQRKVQALKMRTLHRQALSNDAGMAQDIARSERILTDEQLATLARLGDGGVYVPETAAEAAGIHAARDRPAGAPEMPGQAEEYSEDDWDAARDAEMEAQYQAYKQRRATKQNLADAAQNTERNQRKLLRRAGFEVENDAAIEAEESKRKLRAQIKVDVTSDIREIGTAKDTALWFANPEFAEIEDEDVADLAEAGPGHFLGTADRAHDDDEDWDSSEEELDATGRPLMPLASAYLSTTKDKEKRRKLREREERRAARKERREPGLEVIEAELTGHHAGNANRGNTRSDLVARGLLDDDHDEDSGSDVDFDTSNMTEEQRRLLLASVEAAQVHANGGALAPAPEDAQEGKDASESSDSDSDFEDNENDLAVRMALNQHMLRRKDRESLIDDAYNRYAWNDDMGVLPEWFVDDEKQHQQPSLPLTKAEVDAQRARLAQINARPIRKVLEAKGRAHARAARQAARLQSAAEKITSQEGLSEVEKLAALQKLANRAQSRNKKPTNARKLVVTKKAPLAKNGMIRSKRVLAVDKRSKKDLRAKKAQARRHK